MGEAFPKGFSAVYGGFAALLQAFFLADTATCCFVAKWRDAQAVVPRIGVGNLGDRHSRCARIGAECNYTKRW